jgi:hypothetical protein
MFTIEITKNSRIMADNPQDYWHEIKVGGLGAIITACIGWIGSVIKNTLKKIDDSESTKAELHAFKEQIAIKLEGIKEDIGELKRGKK